MNVLVIAPHPDDESIGCGGAICLHADRGDRVVAVFLTSGELGLQSLPREKAWAIREKEAKRAAKILGIAEILFLRQPDWYLGDHIEATMEKFFPILEKELPELIYLPHAAEWHPDHKAALPILRSALAKTKKLFPTLRTYEVWTPLAEHIHSEDISTMVPRKMQAIRAHRSQLSEFDYARAAKGLNQFRGVMTSKCAYAEVFGDGAP